MPGTAVVAINSMILSGPAPLWAWGVGLVVGFIIVWWINRTGRI